MCACGVRVWYVCGVYVDMGVVCIDSAIADFINLASLSWSRPDDVAGGVRG